ncbi:MAG: hypothetical protein KJ772_01790 [Proteobacteria bacterium]|nr:hypothetical protein [Pseudomonadota bacterium]MBU4407421.1 hypothetical protein [Pseudomonadota bacterium]MBU4412034.1 hypothetical protein [Pseudomonadota bacterium]MCG2823412.1 hypothetical protein [Desulfobulbaceae bacterium]
MHSNNQQYLLTMRLFGLFIKCPFREATQDCPFLDIRKLHSLELKFQLAEQMASHPGCRENVRKTHEACYRNRMQQVVKACRGIPVAPATEQAVSPLYHQAAVGQP